MTRTRYARLVCRALYELARYDVVRLTMTSQGLPPQLPTQTVKATPTGADWEACICEAVLLARCLYWKPVLCLQRSVCAVRLFRSRGVAARLVIGYRPVPFLSHAWVEVDGRVVGDSRVYRQQLRILHIA